MLLWMFGLGRKWPRGENSLAVQPTPCSSPFQQHSHFLAYSDAVNSHSIEIQICFVLSVYIGS